MNKVLIAYNNAIGVELHDFFESCADEAKQICVNKGFEYTSVCPPELNEHNVIGQMENHHICFLAGHGDADGIYDENGNDVVSVRTTNYNFSNRGFYSVSCLCANHLCSHLASVGLRFFVGYRDSINVRGDLEPFVTAALSGLSSFLAGENLKTSKELMLKSYDEQISQLESSNPMAAIEMLHNKEALVCYGDDQLNIASFM